LAPFIALIANCKIEIFYYPYYSLICNDSKVNKNLITITSTRFSIMNYYYLSILPNLNLITVTSPPVGQKSAVGKVPLPQLSVVRNGKKSAGHGSSTLRW
jgi:hypothetical protein